MRTSAPPKKRKRKKTLDTDGANFINFLFCHTSSKADSYGRWCILT